MRLLSDGCCVPIATDGNSAQGLTFLGMADKLKDLMQDQLIDWLADGDHDFCIPNYRIMQYEADVLYFTEDRDIYEYEIKTTRTDLFADFKKQAKGRNATKHTDMLNCKHVNKFFFVTPPNLVSLDEIPQHIGLVHYCGNGVFEQVRDAVYFNAKYIAPLMIDAEDYVCKSYIRLFRLVKKLRKENLEYKEVVYSIQNTIKSIKHG